MLAGLARAATSLAAALAAACSALPQPTRPPHHDHHVAAEFVVPANGRLVVPTTGDRLVLHELTLEPPPLGEHWAGKERWFAYSPGTVVTLTTRFRTYGEGAAAPATAAEVLSAAARVRALDTP